MNNKFVLLGLLIVIIMFSIFGNFINSYIGTFSITSLLHQPDPIPVNTPFIGMYYLGSGVNDPFGPPVYQMVLGADGKALLTELPADTNQPIIVISGSWEVAGYQAIVNFSKQNGELLDDQIRMVFEFQDMFLVAVDHPFGNARFQFSLGSGDSHPVVKRVHELLAAIPWIDFQYPDPGNSIYDENTRNAIIAFQKSQGLPVSGVVDNSTWQALHHPIPPINAQPPEDKQPDEKLTNTGESVADRPTYIDGKPVLYLTFDDGPNATYTPKILDVLAQFDAHATFFVIGQNISSSQKIIGDSFARGHYVANHTFSHVDLTILSQTAFNAEVNNTYNAIQDATNGQDNERSKPLCLHPPYGNFDNNTKASANSLGYELVRWDLDSQDWRLPGADQIANYVISNAYPGAIVLMHDGGGYRDQTVTALTSILSTLTNQGYRFEALCH